MDGGPNKGVVLVEMPLLEYHKRKTKCWSQNLHFHLAIGHKCSKRMVRFEEWIEHL
jgi:hypothetical protein